MVKSRYIRKRRPTFTVGDHVFSTNKECATFFNRSVSVVRQYRMNGQLEYLLYGLNSKNTRIEYRKLHFDSIKAFATAMGVHRATVHRRLINNTLEGLEPRRDSEVWRELYGEDYNSG